MDCRGPAPLREDGRACRAPSSHAARKRIFEDDYRGGPQRCRPKGSIREETRLSRGRKPGPKPNCRDATDGVLGKPAPLGGAFIGKAVLVPGLPWISLGRNISQNENGDESIGRGR